MNSLNWYVMPIGQIVEGCYAYRQCVLEVLRQPQCHGQLVPDGGRM